MIFISYRRGDDPGSTGRLFERLQVEGFSSDQIFMDIDSIAPGVDFIRELHTQVTKADIMLAVIGKGWIDARDSNGARRLDNPDDFVRVEIEAALKQDKRVIPVLMQDAPMPRADELPAGLKSLSTRNYIRLTHERFRLDTQVLVKAVRQALDEVAAARVEIARRDAEEIERRRQQEEAARRAQTERQAEQEAARQAQAQEKARQQVEEARRMAMAALSAEQITKAEELANWDFIKESTDPADFRDHLARFPGGVCERMARHKLSTLAWSALGSERRKEALEAFLKEYPDGPLAENAKRELAALERQESDRAREESDRVRAVFEAAKREDRASAMDRFLEAYPDSLLAAEARTLRQTLMTRDQVYKDAMSGGDTKVLQAFLDAYPNSSQASDVRRRLSSLEPKPASKVPGWAKAVLGLIALIFGGALIYTLQKPSAPPYTTPSPQTVTPTTKSSPPVATAARCPTATQSALFDLTLNPGFKSFRRSVSPGGGFPLNGCSNMSGWVSTIANVGLWFETTSGRTITIEVDSDIDTVLAILDPQGNWHFNDDGAGKQQSQNHFVECHPRPLQHLGRHLQ